MSQQLDQRLGGLEVKQAQMETSVSGLAQEVSRLSTTIQKIDDHLEKITQPNYNNWFAAIALIVGVTGGIGGMFIKPIQLQVQHEQQRLADLRQSINDRMDNSSSNINRRMDGIEESFQSHMTTQQKDMREDQHRLTDLMDRISRLETIANLYTERRSSP